MALIAERLPYVGADLDLPLSIAHRWQGKRTGLLIGEINEAPAREHFLATFLEDAGFVITPNGFQMRRLAPAMEAEAEPVDA